MTHTTRILIEHIGDMGYTMTIGHANGQDVVEAPSDTTGELFVARALDLYEAACRARMAADRSPPDRGNPQPERC